MSLLYCCFVTFISTKTWHRMNLLQYLHVICECRAVQTNSVEKKWWDITGTHCCICTCSYCHNIISSGSPRYSLTALVYIFFYTKWSEFTLLAFFSVQNKKLYLMWKFPVMTCTVVAINVCLWHKCDIFCLNLPWLSGLQLIIQMLYVIKYISLVSVV